MLNINERLAIVETQIETMAEHAEQRAEKQDEILELLSSIQEEITRYKGFLGGIVFVLSCMGAFLYKFGAPIIKALSIKTGG